MKEGKKKIRKCSLESLINKSQQVSLMRPICQNRVIYLELCCRDPTVKTSYTENKGTKQMHPISFITKISYSLLFCKDSLYEYCVSNICANMSTTYIIDDIK